MKESKEKKSFSNPDEFNKHLQYTSVTTWVILVAVILSFAALMTWSFVYKIQDKIMGKAIVSSREVSLVVKESEKSRLAVGQTVYIAGKSGEILSIEDGNPVVSLFDLEDNEYTFTIIVKEMHPIEFLIK